MFFFNLLNLLDFGFPFTGQSRPDTCTYSMCTRGCVWVKRVDAWGGQERAVHFTAIVGLCAEGAERVILTLLSHSNMLLIQQHTAGTAATALISASLSLQWINLHSNPQSATLTPLYTTRSTCTHTQTHTPAKRWHLLKKKNMLSMVATLLGYVCRYTRFPIQKLLTENAWMSYEIQTNFYSLTRFFVKLLDILLR